MRITTGPNEHRRRGMRPGRILRGAAVAGLAACLAGAGLSCAPAAMVAAVVVDRAMPKFQDAVHEPQQRPTVVLMESFNNPQETVDSERLSYLVTANLLKPDRGDRKSKDPVVPMIEQVKIADLRMRRGSAYSKMKISEIGKEVGAEQVLYINMAYSEVVGLPGSSMMKGRAAATIKWVDVATARTLWPTDVDTGYPYVYETPKASLREGVSVQQVEDAMMEEMGLGIARLFYKFQVN